MALQAKGIQIRLIDNQTGVQDFCFMTKAQKELVGKEFSTFMRWSSLLGNATLSRLYSLDQSLQLTTPARTVKVIQIGGRKFVTEQFWQPNEARNATADEHQQNYDGMPRAALFCDFVQT